MSNSSKWNIWDFHLHTPCSVLNNGFGDPNDPDIWNNYINQVEAKAQARGIVALGITDYFTIEGYKKISEQQQQGRLSNIFIFPNIEFRVDKIIYRSKNLDNPRRLNFHVLLSPDISINEIEENFLHDLDFVYQDDPFESTETRKLKIPNLIAHGEKLKVQHSGFSEESALKIGCTTVVVQVEQIRDILASRFKGHYLLVLTDEDLSEMNWNGQDHAVRKQLVQMSHAIFSSNKNTREFCLGKKHSSLQAFIEEFKSPKPCLWGCDAHSFTERFLEPDKSRYCWIKGEPSWEGLKQVLYEPDERVKIQTTDPEPDKSTFTIKNLEIQRTQLSTALAIDKLSIEFNPNLVTVIGGRGSGKTALLDLIALSFREGSKLKRLETSFIYRVYGNKGSKNSTKQPIKIITTFQSGESFENEVDGIESSKPFDRADILYLTQNHFEEYSANPDKLNSHIIDLVFEDLCEDRLKYDGQQRNIHDLEQEVQFINLKIQQERNEISNKEEVIEQKLRIKQGEKEDISQRVAAIESRQQDNDNKIFELTERLDELRQKKRGVEGVFSELQNFLSIVEEFRKDYENNIYELNSSLLSFCEFSEIKTLPNQLSELQEVSDTMSQNISILEMFAETLENNTSIKKKEVSELQGTSKEMVDLRQKVPNLDVEIKEIEREKAEIVRKKQLVNELEEKRIELYADIMYKMWSLRMFLQNIIDSFEVGKDEILGKLSFVASINMRKKNNYVQELTEKIDNRAHSVAEVSDSFSEIFINLETLMNGESTNEAFLDVAQQIQGNVKRFKLKRSVTESDYYNAAINRFFDIGIDVTFNCKSLDSLSMGERAIVLLKILLALDDKPLLIDQPEEHLDNRFIFDELVPAFRSAKKRRQIIIATHNANLVVNTDAEQIIVAEPDQGVLCYRYGMIEDLRIREKVTQILEGGELAFKKREEKYGYKF
jgi:ABC-type cobalamin/Fe3+-siderophores transport system ATPase subunit